MKYNICALILLLIITACSSNVVKEKNSLKDLNTDNQQNNSKLALERFIDGSILESKGQTAEAILEYLEALKYDEQGGIFYTIAKNYFKLNKLTPALRYVKEAVNDDPENIDYLTLEGGIFIASHLDDSAAVCYKKIISLDSSNASAYFGLAQLYEVKNPSEALRLYKKIIDIVGPEWSVLVHVVDLNEKMGNVEETINTVEELIRLNPSELSLQKVLIDSYIKIKEYDKAIKKVDIALISFPDDNSLIELKGNALIQKGMWKEASVQYMQLLKKHDFNIDAKIRIGTSFFTDSEKDSNNLVIAKQMFEEIDKDSINWQVKAYLGEIALRQKDDLTAIEHFKIAANLADWNAQIWLRLGGLLFDKRKYDEAIKYLSKAAVKFPNEFGINLIYGLSLSQSNQNALAEEFLQRALNLKPDDITTLSALGYTLNQLKEDDKALVILSKALSMDPKNLQVISIIALINETRKNYQVSDSLYQQALKIDTANVLILNNYAYSLAERKIRLQEALSMSKKAVEMEPKNASYLDTYGWVYFQLEDYKQAKTNIEEAIKYEGKNGTILDHLGDIYFKLKDKSKAFELWQKAFDLDQTKIEIKQKIEKGEL
jgi:tetratricopeptide (TPR) repeat protein